MSARGLGPTTPQLGGNYRASGVFSAYDGIYFFPSNCSFMAAIRSANVSPETNMGLARSSTVVGVAWPQMRQSSSSPYHRSFWRTMYSVQSCCLGGAVDSTETSDLPVLTTLDFPVDCLLVIRTTTCRTPESGISGIWVARSDKTRIPVRRVAGVRLYLSRDQLTFSSLGRLAIREERLLARPVQQTLRSVLMSPLCDGRYNQHLTSPRHVDWVELTWRTQSTCADGAHEQPADAPSGGVVNLN